MSHAVSPPLGARPARTTRMARHRATSSPAADFVRTLWVVWVPLLAIAVGLYARLRQWVGGRSLWLDEVLIADNLVHRGFLDLVGKPLLHSQAAPVLWLWLERLCVDLFGAGERSLRLVPLLSGVAVMVLTLLLGRRVLPAVLVPLPVVLVALQPSLIYYSNEVKQYSTDGVVVLVVVLLAFRVPPRSADGPRLRQLALAGVVAVWLSHVAVLVMAGVSVVLVLRAGDRRLATRTALVLSPWLASLALSYVTVLRPLTQNQPLVDYWGYSFPHSALDLPAWLLRRWYDLAKTPLGMTFRLVGLAVLIVGLVRLATASARDAWLVWAAVPMALLAAALSAYPFAGRLALWLVPLAMVTMAAALPSSIRRGGAAWLLAGTAALTAVFGPSVGSALALTRDVQQVEELRPLLEQFARIRQPGDLVYVEVATREAFEYYAAQTGVRRDGVILFVPRVDAACDDVPALNAGRFASERVWIISSHRLVDVARLGTREDLLARIMTVSREVKHLHTTRADAYLFDPSTGAQQRRQTVPRNPERCLALIRSSR